jgi:hypothetical protein
MPSGEKTENAADRAAAADIRRCSIGRCDGATLLQDLAKGTHFQ